jgi:hypothetical protein
VRLRSTVTAESTTTFDDADVAAASLSSSACAPLRFGRRAAVGVDALDAAAAEDAGGAAEACVAGAPARVRTLVCDIVWVVRVRVCVWCMCWCVRVCGGGVARCRPLAVGRRRPSQRRTRETPHERPI